MSDTKNRTISTIARRQFVRCAGALAAGLTAMPAAGLAAVAAKEEPALADGPRELVAYPQKRPLIRVTTRPPHLETPFEIFDGDAITPNDAFFVRYHLADIPLSIDPETYRLTVRGAVAKPLSLSLRELQRMGQHEVVAVNLCSGNGRGFFAPRVFGAQLGHGAMGNARWGGVPLKTVLEKAGVGAGARQVVFNGLDRPVLPATSDFRKTLDVEHALSAEVLLADQLRQASRLILHRLRHRGSLFRCKTASPSRSDDRSRMACMSAQRVAPDAATGLTSIRSRHFS